MSNDVLIAVPLFVFMGYLVERANLIESLFKSLHLALARVPGSLAVATLVTCAIFATATGIVGAVVTLMGLLALPAMLRGGYNVKLAAGAITAGGCLGILIPPSVLLIVYGATAGVSVVQLYAGAFFPGLMLACLYVLYVIVLAWPSRSWRRRCRQAERVVPLPPLSQRLADSPAAHALVGLLKGRRNADVPFSHVLKQLGIVAMPGVIFLLLAVFSYKAVTTVEVQARYDIEEIGAVRSAAPSAGGLQEPPSEGGLQEPPREDSLQEPPGGEQAPASAAPLAEPPEAAPGITETNEAAATERPAPTWWWVTFAIFGAMVTLFYLFLSFARLEIFKMLLASFFPLVLLIMSVLGSIVLGLATPTEAAAMGALGGMLLAAAYRRLNLTVLKESVFLTAKTTAMVCWLFVGSAIFSAAFALLGGQEIVEAVGAVART